MSDIIPIPKMSEILMEEFMEPMGLSAYRLAQEIHVIERGHFDGIGKPEPLKGDHSGFWSRRIDDSNRLIYRISDGVLEVLSCKGHYED